MSESVAVICEYNPFHNGHLIQLEKIRNIKGSDARITVIMSGSTVQRGTLAVYPKYARAEAAVACGADLVLELPCPFSCGSAEYFARGGVLLADSLGVFDSLCFGSENGDIDALTAVAERLSSSEYLNAIRSAEKSESHQRSAEVIYRSMFGDGFPVMPNDILSVSYIAALKSVGSSITPFTYKRDPGFTASATRTAILSGQNVDGMVPQAAKDIFSEIEPTDETLYSAAALYLIRNTPDERLSGYFGMNGGVSGLLRNNADEVGSVGELILRCTCRKYSASRLRRAILSSVIGITSEDMLQPPHFTNLLAANSRGRKILTAIKKSGFPVVTKPADGKLLQGDAAKQFGICRRADALFALAIGKPPADEVRKMPIIK